MDLEETINYLHMTRYIYAHTLSLHLTHSIRRPKYTAQSQGRLANWTGNSGTAVPFGVQHHPSLTRYKGTVLQQQRRQGARLPF